MPQQTISFGEPPLGLGGDTRKTAFVKCNENFTELYSKLGEHKITRLNLSSGATTWVKLGRVKISQNGEILTLRFYGGAGFNVGSPTQVHSSTLHIKSGNGSPSGLNMVLEKIDGTAAFQDCAYVAIDALNYDIYAQMSAYYTTTFDAVATSTVSFTKQWAIVSALPANAVKGTIRVFALVSSNAASATKLQTARTINGVSFDGTANITVADSTKLPLTGGTLTGTLTVAVGDTVGAFTKLIQGATSTDGGYLAVGNTASDKGYVELGTTDDADTAIVVRKRNGSNSVLKEAFLLDSSHNTRFPGTVTAPTFSGALSGNATTATTSGSVKNLGSLTALTGTASPPQGITLGNVYNNGYPTPYGNILRVGGGGQGEILVGWSGTDGGLAPMYVRSKRDTTAAPWSNWREVVFADTLTTQVSALNAASATKLQTARTINGKSFDGTANVSINTLEPEIIPSGANFNSYTTPGMYYCPANATAATLVNRPTANAFSLLVERHAGVKQTVTEYMASDHKTYIRNMYSGTWGAWVRVYTTIDAPTVADSTKLPLAGGTMTGALKVNNTTASTSATTGAITTTGGVGIGGALFTTGAITSANNITAYSDSRIKDNITLIDDALNKVSQLKGVTYTRTDLDNKDKRYVGLIAQDVQFVMPEAVNVNDDEINTLSVDYQGLVGLLVESIKELKLEIDALKENK